MPNVLQLERTKELIRSFPSTEVAEATTQVEEELLKDPGLHFNAQQGVTTRGWRDSKPEELGRIQGRTEQALHTLVSEELRIHPEKILERLRRNTSRRMQQATQREQSQTSEAPAL